MCVVNNSLVCIQQRWRKLFATLRYSSTLLLLNIGNKKVVIVFFVIDVFPFCLNGGIIVLTFLHAHYQVLIAWQQRRLSLRTCDCVLPCPASCEQLMDPNCRCHFDELVYFMQPESFYTHHGLLHSPQPT